MLSNREKGVRSLIAWLLMPVIVFGLRDVPNPYQLITAFSCGVVLSLAGFRLLEFPKLWEKERKTPDGEQ